MFTGVMNPLDLTVNQLKRAAAIKEQIEALNKELRGILGVSTKSRAAPKKNRPMSAAARKKISAAQRARWANRRRANRATPSVDRKSTRLNSSHTVISYAVFCLKKKKHGCSVEH